MTALQQAAYNAQLGAGLPVSDRARELLVAGRGGVPYRQCAVYVHAVQRMEWFSLAFPAHGEPVVVVGGRGVSRADAAERWIKIGSRDRSWASPCEQACLHELAHIVTSDVGPGGQRREPAGGRASSKGHHHAWRVNFVLIVRQMLGPPAANRLRREFDQWGLPTSR